MNYQEFKEIVAKDVEIFINPLEFGENHRIQYKIESETYDFETNAVISTGTRSKSIKETKTIRGIYIGTMKLYMRVASKIPRQGQTIRVDSELYTVINSEEQQGLQILTLEGYKQR